MRHGANLDLVMKMEAGDFVYIPARGPHQASAPARGGERCAVSSHGFISSDKFESWHDQQLRSGRLALMPAWARGGVPAGAPSTGRRRTGWRRLRRSLG